MGELIRFGETVGSLSGPAVLAVVLFSLYKGWLILPREITSLLDRIKELKSERDELKTMAYRALNIGERVTSVVEDKDPRL